MCVDCVLEHAGMKVKNNNNNNNQVYVNDL